MHIITITLEYILLAISTSNIMHYLLRRVVKYIIHHVCMHLSSVVICLASQQAKAEQFQQKPYKHQAGGVNLDARTRDLVAI